MRVQIQELSASIYTIVDNPLHSGIGFPSNKAVIYKK